MKSPTFRRKYREESPPHRHKSPINRDRSPINRDRSSINRDRSPINRSKRNHSASPSPPRNNSKSKSDLKQIRITINDIQLGKKYSPPVKFANFSSQKRDPDFKGPEGGDLPKFKDQKKIQIEIRRNFPDSGLSHSPVIREIQNPYTVTIPRRKGKHIHY